MVLPLNFCTDVTAWACLFFLHSCSSSLLLCFSLSELLEWVEVFLGFSLHLSSLTSFAKPFSFLHSSVLSMARTKTTANPPPPKMNYRALYSWAPDELLEESSTLTSMKDWRDHIKGSGIYQHCAFARRHDEDISVLPCIPGEPVCGDERANNGVPFFFFYQVVFKRIGMRLPSRGSKGNYSQKLMSPQPSYIPTAGLSSKSSTFCAGTSGTPPPSTSSFTSSK